MKKLILSLALVAFVAAPTFAGEKGKCPKDKCCAEKKAECAKKEASKDKAPQKGAEKLTK